MLPHSASWVYVETSEKQGAYPKCHSTAGYSGILTWSVWHTTTPAVQSSGCHPGFQARDVFSKCKVSTTESTVPTLGAIQAKVPGSPLQATVRHLALN